MLRSIGNTVWALGSLPSPSSGGLADTIISALRAGESRGDGPEPLAATAAIRPRARRWLASRLAPLSRHPRRWSLRFTVPIAVVLGVALSLVNQGGMLLAGDIDVRMCVVCGLNFLLPFAALNIMLLAVASWAGKST